MQSNLERANELKIAGQSSAVGEAEAAQFGFGADEQ